MANIYRGGTNESTFGPIVVVDDDKFSNVGRGGRNKTGASLRFHGMQNLNISNSNWTNSAPLDLFLTNGDPVTVIEDVVMAGTEPILSNSDQYKVSNVVYD